MMWRTHVVAGMVFTSILFASAKYPLSWGIIVATFLGSLAPDLDADDAKIKHLHVRFGPRRWQRIPMFPLAMASNILNPVFGHRGFMHSGMMMLFLIGASSMFIIFLSLPIELAFAFIVGYFSHLMTDAMTRSGIPLLYPLTDDIRVLPKRVSIPTNSMAELLFFMILGGVLLLLLYLFPFLISNLLFLTGSTS